MDKTKASELHKTIQSDLNKLTLIKESMISELNNITTKVQSISESQLALIQMLTTEMSILQSKNIALKSKSETLVPQESVDKLKSTITDLHDQIKLGDAKWDRAKTILSAKNSTISNLSKRVDVFESNFSQSHRKKGLANERIVELYNLGLSPLHIAEQITKEQRKYSKTFSCSEKTIRNRLKELHLK